MNETSAVSLSHFHKHKLDFEANCGRERRMKNNLDITYYGKKGEY